MDGGPPLLLLTKKEVKISPLEPESVQQRNSHKFDIATIPVNHVVSLCFYSIKLRNKVNLIGNVNTFNNLPLKTTEFIGVGLIKY